MSKYRCPVCGATHKDQPTKCRLCGQDMSGSSTVPAYTGGSRQADEKQGGLGSLALIAIVGVLAIGVLAIVLGFTGSNSFIDNIRDKIPGLQIDQERRVDHPRRSVGWVRRPVARRPREEVRDLRAGGQRSPRPVVVGDRERDRPDDLVRQGDQGGRSERPTRRWPASPRRGRRPSAARSRDTNETGFQGYPAIDVSVRDLTYDRTRPRRPRR